MAKIAIGVCGEGRGHAARMAVLAERLGAGHDIAIFSFADGFDFLSRRFPRGESPVRVAEIPGIVFKYTRGRINLPRSIASALLFRQRTVWPLAGRLSREIRDFGADLVLTDFEPALPRAAGLLGIPFASIDHQHFLRACDLRSLPLALRLEARFMAHVVSMYIQGPADTVVSAFFRPPLRRGWDHVVQTGPPIRRELHSAQPSDAGFVLSYLRRHTPQSTLEALAGCGLPVRIYGLGARQGSGNLSFHEINGERFTEDLANCRCMVSAAGNQLIGEALHMGKPMLLLPEREHAEQLINAHFLAAMGCGEFEPIAKTTAGRVRAFLARMDDFRPALAKTRGGMDGSGEIAAVVENRLAKLAGGGTRPTLPALDAEG